MNIKVERRKNPRISVKWPMIFIKEGKTIEGETLDISIDGVSCCTEEPLSLNESYDISITPPDHPEMNISGEVIWSDLYGIDDRDDTLCMGICFLKISDADRLFINNIVTEYLNM